MTSMPWSRDLGRVVLIVMAGALTGWVWNPASWRNEPRAPLVKRTHEFQSVSVDVEELRELFESGDVVIVDARQRAAFEAGHIPGALAAFDHDAVSLLADVRRWLPDLDSPLRVVVVGADSRGFDARRLAGRLRMTGTVTPLVLEGGMPAWKASGMPVVPGWDMDEILRRDS